MPKITNKPDHKYLQTNNYNMYKGSEPFTYWKVKGLLKKKNDIIMVTTFLQVVTVTAAKAPQVLTKVKTI